MKKCPNCGKPVDWLKQLRQWDKEFGKDWESQAMVVIICNSCGEYAFGVDIYEITETEEIYSPALKQKVKIPKGSVV